MATGRRGLGNASSTASTSTCGWAMQWVPVCFAATLCATAVFAQGYEDLKRGWFWYEDPVEEIEEEVEIQAIEIVQQPSPAQDAPAPEGGPRFMTTEWLRDNIPTALDAAMDDPTSENVRVYAYLQRIALDKSEQFARNFQRVVLTDPLLDEGNRVPISTFARRIARDERQADKRKQLAWLSENVGFFYFHDATCVYCRQQVPILERMRARHGLNIMAISMDGSEYEGLTFPTRLNDGHAVRFQIEQVPALVMIWPPNNAAIVSQGLLSVEEMENRLLIVAEHAGVMTSELYSELGIDRPEMLTNNDLLQVNEFEQDPQKWVQRLRKEMGYE
jgi:conjugal transfer pilus assembly protein TraF